MASLLSMSKKKTSPDITSGLVMKKKHIIQLQKKIIAVKN
ncbi:MAG: hypothetical protein RIS29_986 [Bacteroidota bacterium]|jgi:hypothetical protein